MTDGNYLQDNITAFFNALIGNCRTVEGSRPMPIAVFDDIISLQYDSINKVVFIETKPHNYTIVEVGADLRLSEFTKKVDLERMKMEEQ